MNPLDSDQPFSVELMNPNPTSSKTKDGPKYRVSFEMNREDWECFMDANTNGMILEMQGRVAERHQEQPKPVKLKGGPLSIEAAQWCQDDLPNEFARQWRDPDHEHGYAHFKHMIYDQCGVESRAELDHSETAAFAWATLKNRFIQWNEQRMATF